MLNESKRFMEELQTLHEGFALLEKIWSDVGPYKNGKISDETWSKVRNYFQFDDAE